MNEKINKNMNEGPSKNNNATEKWITEDYNNVYRMQYKMKEHLYSKKSEFQKVDVYDTEYLGKTLFNDDLLMTCERDEFVYHEMITHVPLLAHPNPESVLIIGGGDGGTAREVLKHSTVKKVVMVEIDPLVVEACKEHLEVTACELNNEKLELIIDDGVKHVKEAAGESYDVVLVDSTDPIGPAAPLFNESFYNDVKKCLKPGGVVVSQCENPFLMLETQQLLLKIKASLFNKVSIYNYSNITYPSGLWSFSYAIKTNSDLPNFGEAKLRDEPFLESLKYYNHEVHKAAFSLPQFQKQALKKLIEQ